MVNFNEKFKSLRADLVLCDNEGHGMSDLEASYILLHALPTDDESWRTFRQIHASADKPQQLMDDMLRHESRVKVEKRIAGTKQAEEVMYSKAGSGFSGTGRRNERGSKRDGKEKNMTCFNCGNKGHMKKECWSKESSGGGQGRNRNPAGNGRYRQQRGGHTRNGPWRTSEGDGAVWSLRIGNSGKSKHPTTAADSQ